jgi:hypothetical protein
LLTGLAYAVLLYKLKNPWGRKTSMALGILRLIIVTGITFLLLGPLIRHIQNTIIEPSYVIAVDNSRSIPETYSEAKFSELLNQLDAFEASIPGRDYDVRFKDLSGANFDKISDIRFEAPSTDLNTILKNIDKAYEGKNLAGVILVSDGIYNQGSSPIYTNFSFPIYSVGVGDTTEKEDIILKAVNHNKIVYQGNTFILQAEIYNKGFTGRSIPVTVRKKGKVIKTKTYTVKSDIGFQTVEFEIDTEESGMQRYEIIVSPLESEFSAENNILNAYIEIIEGKEKILLYAQSPHPDIKALKSIIEKNDNYEIEVMIPGIEKKPEEKYDLVILHQLPDNRNTYLKDIQGVLDEGMPILYVLGSRTNLRRFNALNRTINIRPMGNRNDNVFVLFNSDFNLFSINEAFKNIISDLPPATVPFGEYSIKGETETILFQRIGKITTKKPLLILNKNQENKEAVLLGDGLWKWRLNEFAGTGRFDGIDNLINKIIQYLSAKEDRRKFRVYPIDRENWDNAPVVFENEIYNDIYEKIFDKKIDLTLTDESGTAYDYSYIISKANSQFRISGLDPGVYQYTASTNLSGKIITNSGVFTVKKQLVEVSNLKADFNLLKELSRRSSGEFYTISDIEALASKIQSGEYPSMIYSTENFLAIINLKWIFFFLLALITLEWGLRKYLGGY